MTSETIIRLLTIGSLSGLLLGVGLRLTVGEVLGSLQKCRLGLIVAANFIAVPVLTVIAIHLFGLGRETAIGMLLLASAPFAPVVPVFTRLGRANLALSAGLTSLFLTLSAFLTPIVFALALKSVPGAGEAQFRTGEILLTLLATLVLPLGLGIGMNHFAPSEGRKALRPIEIVSEFAGAMSLTFATFTEFSSILATGWGALLAMALLSEIALALGWALGGPDRNSRYVVGLGTSNRNIALALLVALESFGGTGVVPAVIANGLLLILLGLLHVACFRLATYRARE